MGPRVSACGPAAVRHTDLCSASVLASSADGTEVGDRGGVEGALGDPEQDLREAEGADRARARRSQGARPAQGRRAQDHQPRPDAVGESTAGDLRGKLRQLGLASCKLFSTASSRLS